NALTTIGAVAGDNDLVIGKPRGDQNDEFQGQFRSSAMVRIVLGAGCFPLALLSLGQSLAVAVQPHGDRQGKDFGGSPDRISHDQTQHDPVVSPTDQSLGSTGNERVVMHASPIE